MVTVAKLNDKVVEIVKVAYDVQFSQDKGWVCICSEIAKPNSLAVRWVPASTRFEWVKVFNFKENK
jgi:hypothetical protein